MLKDMKNWERAFMLGNPTSSLYVLCGCVVDDLVIRNPNSVAMQSFQVYCAQAITPSVLLASATAITF